MFILVFVKSFLLIRFREDVSSQISVFHFGTLERGTHGYISVTFLAPNVSVNYDRYVEDSVYNNIFSNVLHWISM